VGIFLDDDCLLSSNNIFVFDNYPAEVPIHFLIEIKIVAPYGLND